MNDIIVGSTNVFKPRKNHLFESPVSYCKLISYLNNGSWDTTEHDDLFTKSDVAETAFKNSDAAYTIKLDDKGDDTTVSIYNEKENIIEIENLLSCKYYEKVNDNNEIYNNEIFFALPYQKLVEYLGELNKQLSKKDEIIRNYEALIDNAFARELYALTNTNECNLKQIGTSSTYKLVKAKEDGSNDITPVITPFVRLAMPKNEINVNVFISMRGIPIVLKHTYITNGVHIYQYPQYLLDNYDSIYDSIDFMYIEGLSSIEDVHCTISSMPMYSKKADSNGVLFGLNTIK